MCPLLMWLLGRILLRGMLVLLVVGMALWLTPKFLDLSRYEGRAASLTRHFVPGRLEARAVQLTLLPQVGVRGEEISVSLDRSESHAPFLRGDRWRAWAPITTLLSGRPSVHVRLEESAWNIGQERSGAWEIRRLLRTKHRDRPIKKKEKIESDVEALSREWIDGPSTARREEPRSIPKYLLTPTPTPSPKPPEWLQSTSLAEVFSEHADITFTPAESPSLLLRVRALQLKPQSHDWIVQGTITLRSPSPLRQPLIECEGQQSETDEAVQLLVRSDRLEVKSWRVNSNQQEPPWEGVIGWDGSVSLQRAGRAVSGSLRPGAVPLSCRIR